MTSSYRRKFSRIAAESLPLLFLLSILVGCNKETGTHMTQVFYPTSQLNPYYFGYQPVYADQPIDSLLFSTTESWQLRLQYSDAQANWCAPDAEIMSPDFKIEPNSLYYIRGFINFKPNTTGRKRYVRITIDAGDYDCTVGYIQLPYLCITRPARFVVTSDAETSLTSCDSLSNLIALATTANDSICFRVHDKWTLSAKPGSWITPRQTEGKAGLCSIVVDYQPNPTSTERRDTLFLTSGLVTDTIPFLQRGIK